MAGLSVYQYTQVFNRQSSVLERKPAFSFFQLSSEIGVSALLILVGLL